MTEATVDLTPDSVRHAAEEVAKVCVRTPLFEAPWLSGIVGGRVSVKAENLQRTGSFKVRGASVHLAEPLRSDAGVVAASAGNHGHALAFVASQRGIACKIFVPANASISKAEAIERCGASTVVEGDSLSDCMGMAAAYAEESGATMVPPFDHPAIIRGQATIALELAEQAPAMSKVVVPVGGGGLIGGIAGALKQLRPDVSIAGVQAEICAPVADSSKPVGDIRFALADGIAVKEPGELTKPLIETYVDELCAVSEDAIADAMGTLLQRSKLVVEGAGAVGAAALATGLIEPAGSGETVVLLSGGNVDLVRLSAVLRLQEAQADRSIEISTRVPDHPGGLAALLSLVASTGANLVSINHVRDAGERHFHETHVHLLLETRGADHRDLILKTLADAGYEATVLSDLL